MRAAWSCLAGLARTEEKESGTRRQPRGWGRPRFPVLWPARKWGHDGRGLRELVHPASCLLHSPLTEGLESSSFTQRAAVPFPLRLPQAVQVWRPTWFTNCNKVSSYWEKLLTGETNRGVSGNSLCCLYHSSINQKLL